MNELDFNGLAEILLGRATEFLPAWLPGGRVIGREYTCGSISGGPGDSFKVNLKTGQWAEFSGDLKGGDLISLYAAAENLDQGQAAKKLAEMVNFNLQRNKIEPARRSEEVKLGPPPPNTPAPDMTHQRFGSPNASWAYTDPNGAVLFWIARYDTKDGKQFSPWSWATDQKRWVQKGWPAPRPIYYLDQVVGRPQAPVLIVEGEKAATAAIKLLGDSYAVTTWPNGSKAASKADWTPVYGRKIVIWPDADKPGIDAANELVGLLGKHCPEIKVIKTEGQPEGWDIADALAESWDKKKLIEWARPRATVINLTAIQVNVNTQDEEAPSPGLFALWENLGIALTDNGQPICNVDNCLRALEGFAKFKNLIWYDEFHKRYFTTWESDKPREWQDVDTLRLTVFLQRDLGLRRMSDTLIHQASQILGMKRTRNEPREWMDSLKWDGKDRIAHFLVDCLGATPSDYTFAASANFWVGMAARIFRPGCQLDNMIVLEGIQGLGKTRALRAIGGAWYAEANESVTSKDFFLSLQGRLLVELAELDSFSRAEVTRIKQVVSCTTDRFRAPYGRSAQDYPRMSVFVGSTNESNYLRDQTGARRFWPIRCSTIRLDLITEQREQLYAEAVHKFKAGEAWHIMPDIATRHEQEERRQIDEWENIIAEFMFGKTEAQMKEIAGHLGYDMSRFDMQSQKRVAAILRKMGWRPERVRRGWDTVRVWRSPQYQESDVIGDEAPIDSEQSETADSEAELFPHQD